MEFTTQQVERYGTQVHEHPEMDKLRKTQCLCLNCGEIEKCDIAKQGLSLCRKYNIAFAVTRCPLFQAK